MPNLFSNSPAKSDGGYSDGSLSDNPTMHSDDTYDTMSILRRNPKGRQGYFRRNFDRSVSWSNTLDTYDRDGDGDGGGDTFETFETLDDNDTETLGDEEGTLGTYETGNDTFETRDTRDEYSEGDDDDDDDTTAYSREGDDGTAYSRDDDDDDDDDDDMARSTISEEADGVDVVFNLPEEDDDVARLAISEGAGGIKDRNVDANSRRSKTRPNKTPPPPPPPAPPPPAVAGPRPTERKQLAVLPTMLAPKLILAAATRRARKPAAEQRTTTRADYAGPLACATSASMIEPTTDRYGGILGGIDDTWCESDGNIIGDGPPPREEDAVRKSTRAFSNEAKAEAEAEAKAKAEATRPSSVMIPKLIDLPSDIDNVSTMDSYTADSISTEENTDEDGSTLDSSSMGSSSYYAEDGTGKFSFESLASESQTSWDTGGRSRAGSDDTSIRSLTRPDHDYEGMFGVQKRADALAGHIGLILPFWRGKTTTGNDPLTSKNLLESKRDLMNMYQGGTFSPSNISNFSYHLSKLGDNNNEDAKILPSGSMYGNRSNNDRVLMDYRSTSDDVSVDEIKETGSHLSRDVSSIADAISPTPLKSYSDAGESARSPSSAKNNRNMRGGRKSDATEASLADDASDDVSPSDSSSSGLISARSENDSESGELSAYGVPMGEVIPIQDIARSKNHSRRNKDKKIISTQTDALAQQIVIIDQKARDTLERKNCLRSQQEQRKQWSWAWKKNAKKDGRYISDRFHPKELPSGRVNDDDYFCNLSCASAESILSDLKVVEDTAKLMYQKVILGNSSNMGPSNNIISALFSPEETELVLEAKSDARVDDNCEQHAFQREETKQAAKKTKKGGKFSKFLGGMSSKKKKRALVLTPK